MNGPFLIGAVHIYLNVNPASFQVFPEPFQMFVMSMYDIARHSQPVMLIGIDDQFGGYS